MIVDSRSTRLVAHFAAATILIAGAVSPLHSQPGKKSQLATVTQVVDRATIEIIYRRPVARGRELFGKLVPWDVTWSPSADSAAILSTSTDLLIGGSRLRAGRYAVWMIPGAETWTVIFSARQPVFHLVRPQPTDEILRVRTKSHAGDHVEALAFYFPMVDADSAVLNMHWGRTVVPIPIKVP
jgi:hypothetical protein